MQLPIAKNRSWIARIHESIDRLDERTKAAIMASAGEACAEDLLLLCEKHLGRKAGSPEELVTGWNALRRERGLTGGWKIERDTIRGTFGECGCPLVRSGLIQLHPVQCDCSRGMMQAVFSRVCRKQVRVIIGKAIGRGDSVCDFIIQI